MSKLPIRLTDRPIIHFVKVVSFFRDTLRTSWFAITAPAATLAMTPCTTSRRRLATALVLTVTRRVQMQTSISRELPDLNPLLSSLNMTQIMMWQVYLCTM